MLQHEIPITAFASGKPKQCKYRSLRRRSCPESGIALCIFSGFYYGPLRLETSPLFGICTGSSSPHHSGCPHSPPENSDRVNRAGRPPRCARGMTRKYAKNHSSKNFSFSVTPNSFAMARRSLSVIVWRIFPPLAACASTQICADFSMVCIRPNVVSKSGPEQNRP